MTTSHKKKTNTRARAAIAAATAGAIAAVSAGIASASGTFDIHADAHHHFALGTQLGTWTRLGLLKRVTRGAYKLTTPDPLTFPPAP
ncbi:hypothetical protein [Streptomyces sp. CT34]|uniref:hypothetical protein n=1 Tax=Streptomyces sp. CT34 TaxID=1553907 RepID=UPI0005B9E97C|nr:hypothetical protein [Streptomyces sp. CT34]